MASIESRLLNNERRKVTFDVEELTIILDGGKQATANRRLVGKSSLYRQLFVRK